MAMKGSRLARAEAEDKAARRFSIPFFPTLLGVLAVLNIASAVLVLIE